MFMGDGVDLILENNKNIFLFPVRKMDGSRARTDPGEPVGRQLR